MEEKKFFPQEMYDIFARYKCTKSVAEGSFLI